MLYLCGIIKKKSGNMKWSELKKTAMKKGWFLQRSGKRHDIYAHPEKDYRIAIERHDSSEVKPGLLYMLKKQIGF
jgi:predicted RNA binding protein YcfA (HicA-like mRNA interferase family)